MEYLPQTAPKIENVEDLRKFVENEFSTIAKVLNESDILRQRVLHVEPAKPREGMVVQADGSDWDPGDGAGTYNYVGGLWVLMSSGPSTPLDADYIVATANAGLSAERVVTDTATITRDVGTAAQLKLNLVTPVSVANGGTGQGTAAEALGELTQALTEDTTPDRINDFVPDYDASADTGKKVALYNVSGLAVVAAGAFSAVASLDIPIHTWPQFKQFRIYLRDVDLSVDADLNVRLSDDDGVSFEAGAADYAWTSAGATDDSDSEITLNSLPIEGSTAGALSMWVIDYIPGAASSLGAFVSWQGHYRENAAQAETSDFGSGVTLVSATYTDIRFLPSTGTFSGNYTVVGIV